jgi:mono/diheme cytochrome c family protein
VLAAAALLASGCGTGGTASASGQAPDTGNGQKLFSTACGSCHTLSAAGTSGTIGPNLDNAFAADVAQGYKQSSIENLVLDQIRLGSGQVSKPYSNTKYYIQHCAPPNSAKCLQTPMPANIVRGQDAIDVAAYVASVAGQSGYTSSVSLSSLSGGAAIFKGAGCAGCHTLAAAGATGTIGPNLDQLKPALAIVVHQVTVGGGVMPAFKGKLTTAQIQAVAQYVASNAGRK